MRLEHRIIAARLCAPMVSARGQVEVRPLVLVSLHDDHSGLTGYGEAAPLASYDGVEVDDVLAALNDSREVLSGLHPGVPREEALASCTQVARLPQAVSAIDLALWDLAGRRAREPVWRLLDVPAAEPVAVNATIGAADRAGAASAAAAARAAGFACVKVKVGIGDDAGRLAAVRAAAGSAMAIRVDANGAWSVPEALAALAALAPVGIECCEEPCRGLTEIAAVSARAPVPVAIDETALLPGSLDRRVCDAVGLKLSVCGGITGVLAAARRARAAGYEVYLTSTFDGPLGIAAALHAAVAVRPDRACGLATLRLFTERPDPLPPIDGRMAPPSGSGLGDRLTEWYGAPVTSRARAVRQSAPAPPGAPHARRPGSPPPAPGESPPPSPPRWR